jgi:hypothetical protein
MPGDALYDTDFYAWTQQQARLLREVRDNRLDADNLAEEVADLGNSGLRSVVSHLRQLLKHLIKLAASPSEHPRAGWTSEIREHHFQARDAFSPSMRKDIDLADIWQRSLVQANDDLRDHGEPTVPGDLSCPVTLDDLLAPDFEPADARARIERAIQARQG